MISEPLCVISGGRRASIVLKIKPGEAATAAAAAATEMEMENFPFSSKIHFPVKTKLWQPLHHFDSSLSQLFCCRSGFIFFSCWMDQLTFYSRKQEFTINRWVSFNAYYHLYFEEKVD